MASKKKLTCEDGSRQTRNRSLQINLPSSTDNLEDTLIDSTGQQTSNLQNKSIDYASTSLPLYNKNFPPPPPYKLTPSLITMDVENPFADPEACAFRIPALTRTVIYVVAGVVIVYFISQTIQITWASMYIFTRNLDISRLTIYLDTRA
jgi:hypothetical protein